MPTVHTSWIAAAAASSRRPRGRARPTSVGEAILARHVELQITAFTNEPLWDGVRIDHGTVIDDLVGADRARAVRS